MTFKYLMHTKHRETGDEKTTEYGSREDRMQAYGNIDVHTHAVRLEEVPAETGQEAQYELF